MFMNLESVVLSHRSKHCLKLASGVAQSNPVAPQQLTLGCLF